MADTAPLARQRNLRAKVEMIDPRWVVEKGDTRRGVLARVPRFAAENLVGKMGLGPAVEAVERYLPGPHNNEQFLYALTRDGYLSVLDHLAIQVDVRQGRPYGHLSNLRKTGLVDVPPELMEEYPALVGAGLWGRVTLRYRSARTKGEAPIFVVEFQPVTTGVPFEDFLNLRRTLSVDEWVDLLLFSLGYNPSVWAELPDPRRIKWLMLARLIPLVEPQVNLIELGPKNTGKTYLYRNVSDRTFVVSGGMTTPANLFVNLHTGEMGILGFTDCVVFDEVAGLAIQDIYGTMSILKDYMESGRYSRGNREYSADSSLVLLGNLTTEGGQPASYYTHFFRDLPPILLDTAVIDRLHMFIPGWEIPKLTPDALEAEWGLSMDAVGSIMSKLRLHSMDSEIAGIVARYPYRPGVTQRDRRALDKVLGGLLKILYPHETPSGSELHTLLGFAAELRQRVHNQLSKMAPGEFGDRVIGFEGIERQRPADFIRGVKCTSHDRRLNLEPRPGEITALMTRIDQNGDPVDGDIQVVEASVVTGPGGLQMTGFRGKAMEQSAQAAFHYIREHLTDFRLPGDALQGTTIAVHLVSIERRRDGPSAGLAFLLAMVSALTGRPVVPALAVTGEVTLHGEIEPVSGLSAKLYAAVRHGRLYAIVPEANRDELADIHHAFQDQLEVRMVGTVTEALREAFGLAPLPSPGKT